MKHLVTTFCAVLFAGAIGIAQAQIIDVTIKDINMISPDSIMALNAEGNNPTNVTARIFNDLVGVFPNVGDTLRFTGVVMSNPLNSGLGNPDNDGNPSRVHVYVRDTSAVSMGNEYMGIQMVDAEYETTGLLNLFVGDVVEVIGQAAPFFNTMQIIPISVTVVGDIETMGLPASILDPIPITTADANISVDMDGQVHANWDNLGKIRGSYVSVENAEIIARDISTDRPNWIISTDDNATILNFYDISIRYRNDRGDYPVDFNIREDDFEPPPPGAKINLKGFIVFNNDDFFGRSNPAGLLLSIAPFSDSDLEITESPPAVTAIHPGVVGTDPVDATAEIVPDPARSIASATAFYYTSVSADTQSVAASATGMGNEYAATIPAVADGDFVTFWFVGEDNTGATTTSTDVTYRALADGINGIDDIQITFDQDFGDTPFRGVNAVMNINATVQSDPANWRFVSIQDDASAPWSGILIDNASGAVSSLAVGDVINITSATMNERFDVTTLTDVAFTVTGSGSPLADKVVTTDVLTDQATAEAHEGMTLRFDNVTVTAVGDSAIAGDGMFGEWSFSTSGTDVDQILADDAANEFTEPPYDNGSLEPFWPEDNLKLGDVVEFMRGTWWYSFDFYKLVPGASVDVGPRNVALEDPVAPVDYALDVNYPNPFRSSTTIRFQNAASGPVQLEVFDLLGRKVATIVDGPLVVGTHVYTFAPEALASGMYLYRLAAGDRVLTRTMMLLK